MCEEGMKALLEIPELLGIIKKWVLVIRTDIKKNFKTAHRHYISVYVVNGLPIR